MVRKPNRIDDSRTPCVLKIGERPRNNPKKSGTDTPKLDNKEYRYE